MKLLVRRWWVTVATLSAAGVLGRSSPGYGLDSLRHESPRLDNDGISIQDVDFYDELKSDIDGLDKSSPSSSSSFKIGGGRGGGQDDGEENGMSEFDDLLDLLSDEGHQEEDVPFDKEVMYAAYNELHTLAQSFQQDFDAPAVVVVGHQSSGKSALIEALMGFQFNQVGGGTKTRRPIALRMCYNPNYETPRCYLQLPSDRQMIEKEMSLKEIQDYIEQENNRLERDPLRSFDSREINIRMEYKHCPNLILIDTPGLIAAPKISSSINSKARSASAVTQQRALLASAQEAERLVVDKLRCPDYLIVCVEDTADWKHGPTREVVQRADPDLSRTVLVNTKLDTKLPQFGSPHDIQDFLRAVLLDRLAPQKLGGPYYTSIPAGRVGGAADGDAMYRDNAEFVKACADAEIRDRAQIQQTLRRGGTSGDEDVIPLTDKVGLSQLRKFLEEKVDETYRRNVNKILPMLKSNLQKAERRLLIVEQEIEKISLERLKAGANVFCDEFCAALRKALQGTVTAPSNVFGETLSQETSAAGSFNHIHNSPMAVSDRTYDRLVEQEVGQRHHRLYGGSQYHRAIRDFNLATKCLRLPTITEDEIANAAGVGTTHDGVNFLHAACVIALEKAKSSFEPMVEALRIRVTHVMQRLCPIAEYMIRHEQEGGQRTTKFFESRSSSSKDLKDLDVAQNPQFRQLVRRIFDKFVRQCSDSAVSKCQDDLGAITKYVSWSMDGRSSGALRASLPDQTDLVAVYNVALKASGKMINQDESGGSGGDNGGGNNGANGSGSSQQSSDDRVMVRQLSHSPVNSNDRDFSNLLQLMEEAICSRHANRTNFVVGSLVQHIVAGWRESFGRTVTTKFNCYFMLPFVDEFQKFMRDEFQALYDNEDLADVFDVASARRALQLRKEALNNEIVANKRLHEKFQELSRMMLRQRDMV